MLLSSSSNTISLCTLRPFAPIGSCCCVRLALRCFVAASSSSTAVEKIQVQNPVVEMDGDEMARIMLKMIKDMLIFPFVELDIKYYDLGILNRDATKDRVTAESPEATLMYNVAVKCATITPDEARVTEFGLKAICRSPDSTIRNILDGWKKPICIGRHPFGDEYHATDIVINGPMKLKLVYVQDDGSTSTKLDVYHFKGPGVVLAMYNTNVVHNICLKERLYYGLSSGYDLKTFSEWFMRKSGRTSLKITRYAYAVKSKGGYVWACKNYDGDIQNDLLAQVFGSLGLDFCADGKKLEAEAAHGTITRHYRLLQKGGQETSTNSIASIFA